MRPVVADHVLPDFHAPSTYVPGGVVVDVPMPNCGVAAEGSGSNSVLMSSDSEPVVNRVYVLITSLTTRRSR